MKKKRILILHSLLIITLLIILFVDIKRLFIEEQKATNNLITELLMKSIKDELYMRSSDITLRIEERNNYFSVISPTYYRYVKSIYFQNDKIFTSSDEIKDNYLQTYLSDTIPMNINMVDSLFNIYLHKASIMADVKCITVEYVNYNRLYRSKKSVDYFHAKHVSFITLGVNGEVDVQAYVDIPFSYVYNKLRFSLSIKTVFVVLGILLISCIVNMFRKKKPVIVEIPEIRNDDPPMIIKPYGDEGFIINGVVTFLPYECVMSYGEQNFKFSRQKSNILRLFFESKGCLVHKSEFIKDNRDWRESINAERKLAVAINRVREELYTLKFPFEIMTVHGYGYKLIFKPIEENEQKDKIDW